MTEDVAEKIAVKQPEVEGSEKKKDSFRENRDKGFRKPKEQKEFEETILQIARVTRVVKGGRRMRFRVSVIIGDKKGRVALGIGKAGEVLMAIQKAVAVAKKQLVRIPIFEDTIPHEINATFKASRVLLFPAPEGTGVIAGGAVRKILELAGVKNVLSKVHGSRNPLNIAYCTFTALAQLQNRIPPTKKVKEKPEVEDALVVGKPINEEKIEDSGKKTEEAKNNKDTTKKAETIKEETNKEEKIEKKTVMNKDKNEKENK